jgi:hypothetical protein
MPRKKKKVLSKLPVSETQQTKEKQSLAICNENIEDDKFQQKYILTSDIIDKQYRSYNWNDSKMASLITIDGAMIAGVWTVIQLFGPTNVISLTLLLLALVSFFLSVVNCLLHVIPKINSKIGNENNLRTMVGIRPYTDKSRKDEYVNKIMSLNQYDIIKMNCYQITGMCKNNFRSEKLIKTGVILTIVGVICVGISLNIMAIDRYFKHKSNTYTPNNSKTSTIIFSDSIQPIIDQESIQLQSEIQQYNSTENRINKEF